LEAKQTGREEELDSAIQFATNVVDAAAAAASAAARKKKSLKAEVAEKVENVLMERSAPGKKIFFLKFSISFLILSRLS
jgi:hypothetical protein